MNNKLAFGPGRFAPAFLCLLAGFAGMSPALAHERVTEPEPAGPVGPP